MVFRTDESKVVEIKYQVVKTRRDCEKLWKVLFKLGNGQQNGRYISINNLMLG